MGSTIPADHLSDSLFGKTRRAVLSVLYGQVHETFYLRQIARLTGSGMGAVQREVKALAQAGIVRRIDKGRQSHYQANPECPIYQELKSLIVKTAGLADVLKSALAPVEERIRISFVYGSFARGEEGMGSDVDVFVLGEVSFAEVARLLGPHQEKLNREINPSVYPVDEFRKGVKEGNHFLRTVLEGEKLFLIGDEHALARLAS